MLLNFAPVVAPGENAWMLENMYWIRDDHGYLIASPPVRVHHMITFPVGYQLPESLAAWPNFPLSYRPKTNRHALFSGSEHLLGNATTPSFAVYRTMPRGRGHLKQSESDMWTGIHLINRGSNAVNITVELGASWQVRNASSTLPVFEVWFHVCGPECEIVVPAWWGESVVWRTFRMPGPGSAFEMWYHTHSMLASDLRVIRNDCREILPSALVEAYSQQRTAATTIQLSSMALTAEGLEQYMLQSSADVLCEFRSRSVEYDHSTFIRTADVDSGCSDKVHAWKFAGGDPICLLAFVAPTHSTSFRMHFSAFALLSFDEADDFVRHRAV